ncbi:MAG: TIGR02221 family CRISPR-associated protein [Cetobacterium sp.]
MSKILLTTLGGVSQIGKENREYRTTDYSIEGKVYKNKKFILSALDEHHNFDKIFVLGTVSSMWDAFYEYICSTKDIPIVEENYFSLNEQCCEATHETDFTKIDLTSINEILPEKYDLKFMKFGISETEMLQNLNLLIDITESLDEKSEIYLDLTHGFRSNAFYMFMIMNYINEVQDSNDRIKAIFYGMHESKITPTPILNLKIFSQISSLLKGVHDIKNYGNFYTLCNSIEDKNIKEKLNSFSNSLNINYIGEVKSKLKELDKIITTLEAGDNTLIKMIVPRALTKFYNRFSTIKENHFFLLEISKWHSEQKKYAISYLTMRESITAFFCDKYSVSTTLENIENTNYKINKLSNSLRNKSTFEKLDPSYNKLVKLIKVFNECRASRNNIAHSGDSRLNSLKDINSISSHIETLQTLFKDKDFANYIKNRLNF